MIAALFQQEMSTRKALMAVFISSSIWGVLWVPLRWLDLLGYQELWSTFAFLAIPVLPLFFFTYHRIKASLRFWPVYLLAGGFIGAGFSLYCTGLVIGSVTKTTLLFYLTPVWGSILGMIFLSERATVMRWLVNGLGLLGCALIMGISSGDLILEVSDILGFTAGIVWAFGGVMLRRYPEADYLGLVFCQYVLGTTFTLIAIVLIGTPPPSVEQWFSGIVVALITAAIFLPTMALIFRISQYVSPGLVALLMLSEVVLAVLSAMVLLGERLTMLQWLGASLIFLTALLAAYSSEPEGHSEG